MTRARWLLAGLGTVLLVAVWYLLLWSPTSEEIVTVEGDRDAALAQATELRTRAAELRQVRDGAPEAAAALAVADTLVPQDAALPPLLRQMQVAADEAGVRLTAVAPGRPTPVEEAVGGLASIDVSFTADGTYFQLVDLIRRLEDPSITGRGVLWRNATVSIDGEDSYPVLTLGLTATVFSRMDAGAISDAPEDAAPGVEGADADADEAADADAPTTETTDQPTSPGQEPAPAQPVPADAGGDLQ